MDEKDNKKLDELISAWRASGGTILELIDELRQDQGRELAEVYGVSDEGVTQFLELADRADEILARLTAPKPSAEPHRAWIQRMAGILVTGKWHDPVSDQVGGGGGDAELGDPAGPSNGKRFPKALRAWMATGGLAEDFDTLTPTQLLQVGVSQADLAAELACEVWIQGGGTLEDFAELDSGQRAAIMGLFTQ